MTGKGELRGFARARANIALAKYWGKANKRFNLPAVPSISMTVDRLVTETEVVFRAGLGEDRVSLDGVQLDATAAGRMRRVLDRVRKEAGLALYAEVITQNDFPTAAGLASSASGFAALVAASRQAAGLPWNAAAVSRQARQASASAARSVFGGFVELPAGTRNDGTLAARPLFDANHWDVCLVLALTAVGPKAVGSTDGMERSKRTSPLYDAWVERAPQLARKIKRALQHKDLEGLGRAMEQSTMAFHACALSSDPPLVYWQPATLAAFGTVERLRSQGTSVFATMDAGPHVKALTHAATAKKVANALRRTEGVREVLVCKPGIGLEVR